jgi:hypothetical protein
MYNEVCTEINKLKPKNVAGSDTIPAELIENGGRTLKQKIYK